MIPNINMLPKHQRAEKKSNLPLYILLLLALLTLVLFAWQYFNSRIALADLTTTEQALMIQRDQLQTHYELLMSQNKGSLEESVAFVERVSYDVTPLIAETKNLLPENTYLTNYTFSETALTLSVDFETMSDIATYVSRLGSSPFFIDEQLSSVANFEINPVPEDGEVAEEEKFNKVPRYTTNISLMLDLAHLASVGGAGR